MVDVDLLSNLSNQIFVEKLGFVFIVDVEYEKLPIFCSNCKMIGHDLSNCRCLQQNAKVISSGDKTIDTKRQQLCRPQVVGA